MYVCMYVCIVCVFIKLHVSCMIIGCVFFYLFIFHTTTSYFCDSRMMSDLKVRYRIAIILSNK